MIAPQKLSSSGSQFDKRPEEEVLNSRTEGVKQFAKISARVIGLSAAAFVLLARDGIGPYYFDAVGKALFWSGLVLVPLVNFNRDGLRYTSGWISLAALSALQAILVVFMFGKLQDANFIILTPLCVIQCLLFFTPFMLIRKHHTGVWY